MRAWGKFSIEEFLVRKAVFIFGETAPPPAFLTLSNSVSSPAVLPTHDQQGERASVAYMITTHFPHNSGCTTLALVCKKKGVSSSDRALVRITSL